MVLGSSILNPPRSSQLLNLQWKHIDGMKLRTQFKVAKSKASRPNLLVRCTIVLSLFCEIYKRSKWQNLRARQTIGLQDIYISRMKDKQGPVEWFC